jgi:hypothetical protein
MNSSPDPGERCGRRWNVNVGVYDVVEEVGHPELHRERHDLEDLRVHGLLEQFEFVGRYFPECRGREGVDCLAVTAAVHLGEHEGDAVLVVASRVRPNAVCRSLHPLSTAALTDKIRPAHGFAFVRISAGEATIVDVAEYLGGGEAGGYVLWAPVPVRPWFCGAASPPG